MKIKNIYAAKYRKGFPLLFSEALEKPKELEPEGNIVDFRDMRGNFICRGMIGKQNKGLGWMLTNRKDIEINDKFFETKFKAALEHRIDYIADKNTTCYRIFNGEGDGIGGFTIDYFDGFYLINWYNAGIYRYKDVIISTLHKLVKVRGLYEKKRFKQQTASSQTMEVSYVMGSIAPDPLIVLENGLKFAIHLEDGAMVGIFLDQRDVRQKIRTKYAAGKDVLNTFSYTGAFSVFAANGGAKSTTSVDLAKRSLAKTMEHFELNNIELENNKIIVEDIFHYFKYAKRKELKFDLVIMDPPSFARSKKYKFSVDKDFPALLKDAIAVTAKKGVIVASTNCASFDMKKFKSLILEGFDGNEGHYKIEEEFKLPTDFNIYHHFAEGNYLKVVILRLR